MFLTLDVYQSKEQGSLRTSSLVYFLVYATAKLYCFILHRSDNFVNVATFVSSLNVATLTDLTISFLKPPNLASA